MAWSPPRTWTTNEVVTAAMMNAHVRDNELVLKTSVTDLGQISGLSAATLADLSGTSLTGVALLGASNSFADGTTRFSGSALLRVPVGADKWAGTKGVDAAGLWVEGDYLHHIDQNKTTEWRYLGTLVSSPGALPGFVMVSGARLRYTDSNGEVRECLSSSPQHADSAAAGGLWVETYAHWVAEAGAQEYAGHQDVNHQDHDDHEDHDDHADSGPHVDHDDHDDHTDGPTEHVDHDDGPGHGDVDPVPHEDHDDHDDTGAHADHDDHDDGTPHTDQPEDKRPVVV